MIVSTLHNPQNRLKPRRRLPLTAAEFFAGIGLVRLALENQNWRVVWANDIDEDKAEIYRANFGDKDLLIGDVHLVPASELPPCTLYTASFPCNDLSIAGSMSGLNGKESGAFWGLIKILREKNDDRPPLVMLENVVGFLMSAGGKDFETALVALCDLGYAVDVLIINASTFRPQSRPRLFVIAKLDDGRERTTSVKESDVRPSALVKFINLHPNIRWDIRDVPRLPTKGHTLTEIIQHNLTDDDKHWWDEERAKYFMGQLSPRHEVLAKLMIAGKDYSYATAFRRVRNGRSMAELRTDGIAGCLRTPRGGSGRQILFKGGKGRYQVRLLTARECARLQGVPESYKITVPLNKALFGFGDAVCVPVVEWIVKHYLTPLTSELAAAPSMFTQIAGGR